MKHLRLKFESREKNIYLVVTIVGLLFIAACFLYYLVPAFNIPDCGTPNAGSNCGDGDFGGVGFLFIGVPVFLAGLAGIVISSVFGKSTKPQTVNAKVAAIFLRIVLSIAAGFILLLLLGLFITMFS